MSFLCRLRCIGCLRPVQIARFLSSSEASSTNEPQFAELFDELVNQNVQKETNFAKLFKTSKFVELGDFDRRLVVGKIVHRVGHDLYIDFGSKFNTVCRAPEGEEGYYLGAQVLLRLHDPELSERFLGSRYDLTLLEADADLIGLYGASKRNFVDNKKAEEKKPSTETQDQGEPTPSPEAKEKVPSESTPKEQN